ncbi:MAG: hypothetical protein AB2417_15755 [Clostridiaceae bacterium]
MAGNAKPDVPNLGKEGKINFLEYNDQGRFDKIETLLDGDLKNHTAFGVILYSFSPYIEFELPQKSNIWAYGQPYSDGGGYTPMPVYLYKEINGKFERIGSSIPTKNNSWYSLCKDLEIGVYRIQYSSSYTMFTEWYIEHLLTQDFLIRQKENLYYIDHNYLNLGASTDANKTNQWLDSYGYDDIEILMKDLNYKKTPTDKGFEEIYKSLNIDFKDIKGDISLKNEDDKRNIYYDCDEYKIIDKIRESNGGLGNIVYKKY